MSTVGELACSYAVMILEDEGISITSEKIATVVKSAGLEIEGYWPMLFAKMAEKRNVTDLIMNVGAGGGGGGAPVTAAAPAAGGGGSAAAAPAKEEKKDEPAEESDGDLGFGLFD
uniref:60S acidic ribosomal protein P1-2 n=3 Tax=Noccaea caerulescens TaxID=107243 RepID=A0A1J3GJF2_NOCCA